MSRIMAIDYGRVRVGIAISDPLNIFAQPLTTIKPTEIIDFIKNYEKKEKINTIVLGFSKNSNNSPTDTTNDILILYENLKKIFPHIKIVLFDERFTTTLAQRYLIASGKKKKERQNKANLDKISASILLNDYLNYLKNTNQ